jgi:hypothetical protein
MEASHSSVQSSQYFCFPPQFLTFRPFHFRFLEQSLNQPNNEDGFFFLKKYTNLPNLAYLFLVTKMALKMSL